MDFKDFLQYSEDLAGMDQATKVDVQNKFNKNLAATPTVTDPKTKINTAINKLASQDVDAANKIVNPEKKMMRKK